MRVPLLSLFELPLEERLLVLLLVLVLVLVLVLLLALSKLLLLLLLLSLEATPPVLTEVRERPRRDIIR